MPGRVFVTGAAGFVGSAVLEALLASGYSANALSNHRKIKEASGDIRMIPGGLFDGAALDAGLRDCEAVIHLVGIIMEKPSRGITFERIHLEGTRTIVDAAKRAGVKRYVHMSALGARPNAVSRYHQTKFAAEEYVRASGLEWTIFRPSLIHGPRGEFMQMEARWARMTAPPFLFMPYFGGKKAGRLQPVLVDDVARAFVDALTNRKTIGEIYPVAGTDRVTWPQMHKIASRAIVGRPRLTGSMPVPIARVLAHLPGAPFNTDQVIMSQEDNTTDISKLEHDFGWSPAGFEASLQSYAAQM